MVLSSTYSTPPTSTPPTIQESLAKLADNINKLELVVKRLVAKRLSASTANPVSITSQTTITETTTDHVITAQNTPTVIMPPPDTQPNITLPPNNRQQFLIPKTNKIVANKPVAEFLNLSIVSITNIQHEVDTHTGVSIPTFIKTMLTIFSCLETIAKDQEPKQYKILDEIKKQGLIVKGSPQTAVLSHPSVGCFLSHCGWNSLIESVTAGVPVIACPEWSEQPTNGKLVTDSWGVGVKLSLDSNGFFVEMKWQDVLKRL
ncbi:UDP-glycosyltransferase 84B1-like protein [Tanacetum coccineum]|uniref:UDP-glycosyltransferase 84B1-like protein n=1 Tax=Tanacetum coccineum TaxID=301880 RepID=A0ABQ4Z0Z0_9ASTR